MAKLKVSQNNYRITYHRPGVQFELEYRASMAGAVKATRMHGGFSVPGKGGHDYRPHRAVVEVRVDTGNEPPYHLNWIGILEVSAVGVKTLPDAEKQVASAVVRLRGKRDHIQSLIDGLQSRIKSALQTAITETPQKDDEA
jgi:hypothetical protein